MYDCHTDKKGREGFEQLRNEQSIAEIDKISRYL